jgi:hypothetical protein
MLKLVDKIEILANKLLYRLAAFLHWLYQRFVPQKLKERLIHFEQRILNAQNKAKEKAHLLGQKGLEHSKEWFEKIKKVDLQKSSDAFKEKSAFKLNTLKELGFKGCLLAILGSIKSLINTIKTKVAMKTLVFHTTIVSILTIASFHFYQNFNKTLVDTGLRRPAAVEDLPIDVRPDYYKNDEKLYRLTTIILPILIESSGSMRSVKMDIFLQTSNRQGILFLKKNNSLIRDFINWKIEPIVPSFPLESEGRGIIKEKIILELNNLLQEYKVESRIEKVYFQEIIGG